MQNNIFGNPTKWLYHIIHSHNVAISVIVSIKMGIRGVFVPRLRVDNAVPCNMET